jgi:hypothetical protein
VRQSGRGEFDLETLLNDPELVLAAKKAADRIIEGDSALAEEAHRALETDPSFQQGGTPGHIAFEFDGSWCIKRELVYEWALSSMCDGGVSPFPSRECGLGFANSLQRVCKESGVTPPRSPFPPRGEGVGVRGERAP